MKIKVTLLFVLFFPFSTLARIDDSGASRGTQLKYNCVVESRCTTIKTENHIIERVEPIYPTSAWEKHIEGYIDLEFSINPSGKASDFEVIHSEPPYIFDETAIQAVQLWYFEAISERAKAEKITVKQSFVFKLGAGKTERAQYVVSTGILEIPGVNVTDQFGVVTTYKVIMKLKSSNKIMMFELVEALEKLERIGAMKQIVFKLKASETEQSQYVISTGILEIPSVNVIDQFGSVTTYKVTMKLKSSNKKMIFELLETLEK